MALLPDELRLAITLGLNALLLWASYRFVRRWVGDRLQAAMDACLLWYLVQYIIVAGLGVLGILSGGSIVLAGLGVAALLLVASTKSPPASLHDNIHLVFVGASCLLVAYLFSIIWGSRYAPTIANDSLAYQLPAAVQWLQTGRLSLQKVWFFNPANSFSPLAGSAFVAWLMGPMGSDVLARFVEAPALVFLFIGVVQLSRALGANLATSAVLGLAVAFARPFVSQTILAKDDLPLAAFLVAAMVALSADYLRDPLGPWRVGVAIGLLMATKFTATFSLPVILLMIDAPWRSGWRWKKHAIAGVVAVVLFAPWYLRNLICYGSPAFPFNVSLLGIHLFAGPLTTIKTDRLNSLHGVIDTLTGTYYSMPPIFAAMLLIAWIIAGAIALRYGFLRSDEKPTGSTPLARACLLGPVIAIAIFIVRSPAAEMRFIAPSLAVLTASVAIIAVRWQIGALIIAAFLAAAALGTSFKPDGLLSLAAATGVALLLLIASLIVLKVLNRSGRIAVSLLTIVTAALWAYVAWPSYLNICRVNATTAWEVVYGPIAQGWETIRDQTETDCTVAYTNTFLVYPLFGPELNRHLIYAPTRPGVHELHDLPTMRAVIGEDVPGEVSRVMMEDSDRQTWVDNLKRSGANYLFVAKLNLADPTKPAHPPELDFISPNQFQLIFENEGANVYRVNLNN